MPRYESDRRPEINADDLANVAMLLGAFDRITFNGKGELVALMTVNLPVIGPITISLYDREDHIQVYRGTDSDHNAKMWSGCTRDIDHNFEGKYDRDNLIRLVKSVLRDEIAKNLLD